MKLYYDIESGSYVTETELHQEYLKAKQARSVDYDFVHYLENCHTRNNGTLYTFRERMQQLEKAIAQIEKFNDETCEDLAILYGAIAEAYGFYANAVYMNRRGNNNDYD